MIDSLSLDPFFPFYPTVLSDDILIPCFVTVSTYLSLCFARCPAGSRHRILLHVLPLKEMHHLLQHDTFLSPTTSLLFALGAVTTHYAKKEQHFVLTIRI